VSPQLAVLSAWSAALRSLCCAGVVPARCVARWDCDASSSSAVESREDLQSRQDESEREESEMELSRRESAGGWSCFTQQRSTHSLDTRFDRVDSPTHAVADPHLCSPAVSGIQTHLATDSAASSGHPPAWPEFIRLHHRGRETTAASQIHTKCLPLHPVAATCAVSPCPRHYVVSYCHWCSHVSPAAH
jgi:hypothetical protein